MRGLFDREPAERPKLDDPGQVSVDLVQAIQGVIQREDGYLVWGGDVFRLVDGYAGCTLAPLVGAVTTGVIDEDPAHDLRRDTKEMRAILPIDQALVDESDVGLMDQGRRLQGVVGALAPKLARGHPAELRVDEWQQLGERSPVATTPIAEESRDVMRRHHEAPSTSVWLPFDPFGSLVARSAHRTETVNREEAS